MLRRRAEDTGDPRAAALAVEMCREALKNARAHHPDLAGLHLNLGLALLVNFQLTGRPADVDGAIASARAASRARASKGRLRHDLAALLAEALQERAVATASLDDLAEAVRRHENAVTARGTSVHALRHRANLGVCHRTQFHLTGDQRQLDKAVGIGRAADEGSEDGQCLSTLQTRYEHLGGLEDLTDAIACFRAAVAATAEGHPNRGRFLANLAPALRALFERTQDPQILAEAIAVQREVLRVLPAGHAERDRHLTNLGNMLRTSGDGASAIDCYRSALASTPDNHPRRAATLANLGAALWKRAVQRRDAGDAAESAALCAAAVATTPLGHLDRCGRLSNHGHALRAR